MSSSRLVISADAVRTRLRNENYSMIRKKGSHEHWRNPETKRLVTLAPHSKDISGEKVRDIYRQAGWCWGQHKKVNKKQKATSTVAAVQPIQKQPISEELKPEKSTTPDFSLVDERIKVVEMAEAQGDVIAAKHYDLPRTTISRWRTEFGDTRAWERSWDRRAYNQDKVEALAKTILTSSDSPHKIAFQNKVGMNMVYSVAQGKHRNLTPETAARMKAYWEERIKQNKAGTAVTSFEIIQKLFDMVVTQDMPIVHAGKALGLSETLAFRIVHGRHPNVTSEQREGFKTIIGRQGGGHRPVKNRADLSRENRMLRKENDELRQALKQALDLVAQISVMSKQPQA